MDAILQINMYYNGVVYHGLLIVFYRDIGIQPLCDIKNLLEDMKKVSVHLIFIIMSLSIDNEAEVTWKFKYIA